MLRWKNLKQPSPVVFSQLEEFILASNQATADQEPRNFFTEAVNISGIANHMFSLTTTQFCHRMGIAMYDTKMNRCNCIPIFTNVKTFCDQIWSTSQSFPIWCRALFHKHLMLSKRYKTSFDKKCLFRYLAHI